MTEIWLPDGADPTRVEISTDPTQRRMVGYATHGNTPFDVPFISELDDNLYQGGCETGMVLPVNILHVISLYPWEQYEIRHEIRSVLSVVMYDSESQAFEQVDSIAQWALSCMRDAPTLIHCQAGLNRSSLVAARVLMIENCWTADQAISFIREKRSPACLCNKSFETFLKGL